MPLTPLLSSVVAFAAGLGYEYANKESEGAEKEENESEAGLTPKEKAQIFQQARREIVYEAKKQRLRAERAIQEAAKHRWVKEGYQEFIGKVPKVSATGKKEPEEKLSRYNKKMAEAIENESIRIINPELEGEQITLKERVEFETIRANVAIKIAAEEKQAKEVLQKYITNKSVDETLRERLQKKESWEAHKDSTNKPVPVELGEEVTLVIEEFDAHHSRGKNAVCKMDSFTIFVKHPPESFNKGDKITCIISDIGGNRQWASAIISEQIDS